MSQRYKQRKSNRVLLTRSGNKPNGKEIQGLVFDHPSMPKIVTITSGLNKKSPQKDAPSPPQEHNPTGNKYPTGEKNPTGQTCPTGRNDPARKHLTGHRAPEQHTTGHFTHHRSAAERSALYPTATVHCTTEQHATVHQTSAQYPTRSFPPALIRTSNQDSTIRQISRPEIPSQAKHSQIACPPYHQNGPSTGNAPSTSVAAVQNTQFQHIQHVTDSQRTQEATLRRNSTGTLWHHSENGVQRPVNEILRENISRRQHRKNIGQPSIDLGNYAFAHDFHLNVWRESHARAVGKLNPTTRRQDQHVRETERPARRLEHHPHLPMTSSHHMNGHGALYRSLSVSTGVQSSPVFRGETTDNLSDQHSYSNPTTGSHTPSSPSPMTSQYENNIDKRRYSADQVILPNSDVSTTEPHNSAAVRTSRGYCLRVQNAEGTSSWGSDPGGRRVSISTDGYNPVVRSAEETNLSAGGIRRSSNNGGEYNLELRNSQVPNSGQHRIPSSTSVDYNSVTRNAEGRNFEVQSSGNVRKSSSPLQEPSRNSQRHEKSRTNNRRPHKSQQTLTVVVISDSEDEDTELPPVNWNDDCDQDVFMAEESDPAAKENLGSNSPSSSDSGCIITKVTTARDGSRCLSQGDESLRCETQKGAVKEKSHAYNGKSSRYDSESHAYDRQSRVFDGELHAFDVNNNERQKSERTSRKQSREDMGNSSEGVGATCKSVLFEQRIAGQSGTRVFMNERSLFEKDDRGTKRHLERDNTQYFVAGEAEVAGSFVDHAARKIRRVLSSEVQSEVCERDRATSGESATVNHEYPPKLARSCSENYGQVGKLNAKNVRSGSLTFEPGTFKSRSSQSDNSAFSSDIVRKLERAVERRFSIPKVTNSRCGVETALVPDSLREPETSSIVSSQEIPCGHHSAANENVPTVVKLQKTGPKPTGIVVGIKQQAPPEANETLESETAGSGNEMKNTLQTKTDSLQSKLLQLRRCISADSKNLAKGSGTARDVVRVTNKEDLDVLHFNVVRKDASAEGHVKCRTSSREQASSSQQWEAYSLKLEQERLTTGDCGENLKETVKRNSWQELNRKLAVEENTFTESKRETSELSNTSRKRAHALENLLDNLFSKSYKFHDATKKFSQKHAARKLSNESASEISANSSNTEHDSRIKTCESYASKSQIQMNTNKSELQVLSYSSNAENAQQSSTSSATYSPSEEKPFELNPPENEHNEIQHSNVKIHETSAQEKSCKIGTSDIRSEEILFEERPSEVETCEKSSHEIPPLSFKPPSSGDERQGRKSPQKEVYSIKEWTEILQGRIAQVRESIEEETTPWKTKNKKKVLEKLENHLAWLTGPAMDETIFVSRKLQFFQTMKKQYELMNRIKTQRQTMKCSDSTSHPVEENEEKQKEKAAKEVEVPKKTNEVKKPVKNYKPKR